MKNKVIYWIATGLLSCMMLMSAGMYFFKYKEIATVFSGLGYPAHLIYPLGIAKILGVIAILTKKCSFLKEWAYAGFFFNFSLAFLAHISKGDGKFPAAIVALVLLIVSYFFDRKLFKKKRGMQTVAKNSVHDFSPNSSLGNSLLQTSKREFVFLTPIS